jgi:hypothetical protein
MPIAAELSRLIAAKAAIRTAIEAKGVSVPIGDTLEDYAAHIDAISTGPATAPSAFTVGMWSLTGGNAQATIGIGSLPANGGSPITALQYRQDGGAAVTMSGTGTGDRIVASLTNGTEYDYEVRAVNAIDAGAWSDLKSVTPAAPGVTYIRFSTLSGMTETGNGTDGWIYTGSASNGTAGTPDWNLPLGTAGGFAVDTTPGGSEPMLGLYTSASGAWDAGFLILMYVSGLNWILEGGPGFTNLATTPRTHTAGDIARIRYSDTGNTYLVEIARAADPATWLTLGTGTYARSGPLYPRLTSFGAAGAVLSDARVVT